MMSEIKFYNSYTRRKDTFVPLKKGEISMYVCGVTPYDYAHIGNARPAIVFDTLYRFLKAQGNKVTYLRNFTDVDDKIIARANEKGITSEALTQKFMNIYHEDMKKLNVLGSAEEVGTDVTGSRIKEPLVTGHIQEIIQLIVTLLDKDLAYVADSGDVLYDTTKFTDYGKLSNKKLDELIAGARVEVSEDKKNSTDFVLWKSAKPEEPKWDFDVKYSSVNAGRPGWHIECSAMSHKEFGHSFDIHAGGEDLQFPHHECEIAQSKGACGGEYARYWLHNAFVNVGGEKMSKSLGNFKTIHSILEKYSGEAVRLWMLSTHYRKPIDLTEEALDAAERRVTYLNVGLRAAGSGESHHCQNLERYRSEFIEALSDDLNTSKAIAIFGEMVKEYKKAPCPQLYNLIKELGGDVLGVYQPNSHRESLKRLMKDVPVNMSADEIEAKIEKRNIAKSSKNWIEADRIRDELTAQGIILEDSKDGTTWRRG